MSIQGSQFLGLQSLVLSGSLSWNVLTLTGTESVPMKLKHSSQAEIKAKVEELNKRSQDVIQEKNAAQLRQNTFEAQNKYVANIDRITSRMQKFDVNAEVHLGRFHGVESEYEEITAKIVSYVNRERQLAGKDNASIARGQLSINANKVSYQTDQIHDQVEALQSSFDWEVKPIADESKMIEQQCNTLKHNSGNLTPSEVQHVNDACMRLEAALIPFRQKDRKSVV